MPQLMTNSSTSGATWATAAWATAALTGTSKAAGVGHFEEVEIVGASAVRGTDGVAAATPDAVLASRRIPDTRQQAGGVDLIDGVISGVSEGVVGLRVSEAAA